MAANTNRMPLPQPPELAPGPVSAPTPGSTAFNPLDALRMLHSAGGALFTQATLYGQLARVEWAEERGRLFQMLALVLLAFACLLCTILLAGILVLVFSWDTTYRTPAALALIAVYMSGIGIAWYRLKTLMARGSQAFAATRAELAADIGLLRSKL
jgi:uncharacterized membrane protein YqjE